DHGFFWMSSHNGILRVSRAELNACADGKTNYVHCLTYGEEEGLPGTECSGGMQPAGCRTSDGRFCFPTIAGAVIVDPNAVNPNHRTPPVRVEEVLVDNNMINPKGSSYEPLSV